jgi:beta-glucosidase
VQPQWVDAGGGFDRSPEWATRHFLEFVRVAVTEFGPAIDQWCTFNEPGVLVSSGWVTGFFPPGRTLALAAAGRALLTVLRAHTAATSLIRAMAAAAPGTLLRPSIGIVHNIMPYEALPLECLRGWSPPWARAAAALGHAAWGNDAVLDYLKTGAFEWAPAGRWGARVSAQDPRPPAVDWFGLNFYGRVLLDPLLRPTAAPGELVNDFQQGVWPAGFKAALHAAARVGAPVWVMETGLPDAGDGVRGAWARAYMRAAAEAVDEGVGKERGGGRGGGKGVRAFLCVCVWLGRQSPPPPPLLPPFPPPPSFQTCAP